MASAIELLLLATQMSGEKMTQILASNQQTTDVWSTTAAASGMSVPVIAGVQYRIHAVARLSQTSGGTQGMRAGFTGPALSQALIVGYAIGPENATVSSYVVESIGASWSAVTTPGGTDGIFDVIFDGTFTPSVSGNVQMTFCNDSAGTAQINNGSFMELWPVNAN